MSVLNLFKKDNVLNHVSAEAFNYVKDFLSLEKDQLNDLNHYSFLKICLKNVTEYTGSKWDLEIVGPGYFELCVDSGMDYVYSRRGSFVLDPSGKLICKHTGATLVLDFSIPENPDNLTISPCGQVSVWNELEQKRDVIGFIKIAVFENPSSLSYLDSYLFYPTKTSGQASLKKANSFHVGFLRQGFIQSI